MPRPFKRKRGRYDDLRDMRKMKRTMEYSENALRKRRKLEGQPAGDEAAAAPMPDTTHENGEGEAVFFGLLDPDEQTYYTNVNEKITSNDFESPEERQIFLQAVYSESEGKEAKLAASQSCSRHLERLISVSAPAQLAALFAKLAPNLLTLSQHRFGSHVLENLFVECAPHVRGPDVKGRKNDAVSVQLESLFIQSAESLKPQLGYLLTDKFGSHVVRVLVLVLTGQSLEEPEMKKMLASKKKEQLHAEREPTKAHRAVPNVFKDEAAGLTKAAVASLDTTSVRALATHPVGNPMLQLLLKLELLDSDKGRSLGTESLFHKLFSPNSLQEGSEGSKLVSGLTYDQTGAHLIEVVVQHAPGKVFKKLYQGVWKPRLASMAKNDVASYVAVRILQRLGKDDLAEARDIILPELATMINRRRFMIIQTLVDRCVVRYTDLKPVAEAFKAQLGKNRKSLLQSLLYPDHDAGTETTREASRADKHASLLTQSLLRAPSVSTLFEQSILDTDTTTLVSMAKDPSASRVLQVAVASTSPTAFRKQLIPKFHAHISELAIDQSGSYFVEALWDGTKGLHFLKERLATELAKHESKMRESVYGRNVWRNWSMDLYTRRRGEWAAKAKGVDGNV
jgi:nucleolar protein 9